jgi:hypothetical protein
VGIETRPGIGQPRNRVSIPDRGIVSRLTLGPTHTPIQWVQWALLPKAMWLGSEVEWFYSVSPSKLRDSALN